MSRVFCVQNQQRMDRDTGQLVPKFDLSSAYQHGNVEFLLSHTAAPFNLNTIIPELHEKLKDFTSEDHLLLIGNPVLIGLAVAIAADYNEGNVSVLQWNGRDQRYIRVGLENVFQD